MALYLIGIGLSNEKDITVNGLELIQNSDLVYLENYTSLLQCSVKDLENFYGKKIILANREMTEQKINEIVNSAKDQNISFLIVGDPFSATTHIEIFKLAKEKNIEIKIINNASVITAVGITGLQLYKFGKITSIPFIEDHPNLETPYLVLKENQKMGLHTLFLLDLHPEENKFMTVPQALEILETIEKKKKEKLISADLKVIGCARLGSDNFIVKYGTIKELQKFNFGKAPHCLIIPGKLHFAEEEMLELWR